MWQTDRDKLHKHRVDKGITKPAAGDRRPVKPRSSPSSRSTSSAAAPTAAPPSICCASGTSPSPQIDYSDDHDLRRAIRGQTGRKTSPHVFIHGKSIGGYDELRELDESGASQGHAR
jgi:glutaredoxin